MFGVVYSVYFVSFCGLPYKKRTSPLTLWLACIIIFIKFFKFFFWLLYAQPTAYGDKHLVIIKVCFSAINVRERLIKNIKTFQLSILGDAIV